MPYPITYTEAQPQLLGWDSAGEETFTLGAWSRVQPYRAELPMVYNSTTIAQVLRQGQTD